MPEHSEFSRRGRWPAWRRGDWRRAVALLVVLVLLTGLVPPAGPAAAAEPEPRVPVILIHGIGSSPEEAWGVPGGPEGNGRTRTVTEAARTGFFTTLVAAGYVPGETLFWLDYSDVPGADFIRLAGERLAPLVEEVRRRSGAERVDIIAHSMGALVARHYVERMGGEARVRSVVMVAAPQRGSFLASLLKNAGAVQSVAREEPAPAADWSVIDAAFDGETPYVARVTSRLFLPVASEVLASRVKSRIKASIPVTVYRWLIEKYPAETGRLFLAAQVPADARGVYPLTRAYLHLLALNAASDAYRTGLVEHVKEAEMPPPKAGGRWWEPFVGKLVNGLTEWGLENVAGWGRRLLRASVLALAASQAGVKPDSPAITRLVQEKVDDLDPGGFLANHFLAAWNGGVGAANRLRPVQYIHVAGEAPNLWGLLLRSVEPNDLAVEAGSTLLPPAAFDRYHKRRGLWRGSHSGLLWDPQVQRQVIDALDPLRELEAFRLAGTGGEAGQAVAEGVLSLRADRAAVLSVELPERSSGGGRLAGRLTLTLEPDRGLFGFAAKPLPPVGLAAWTSGAWTKGLAPIAPFEPRQSLELPVDGKETGPLLIAARLLPGDGETPDWAWYLGRRPEQVAYRLVWEEEAAVEPASDPEPVAGGPAAGREDSTGAASSTPPAGTPGDGLPPGGVAGEREAGAVVEPAPEQAAGPTGGPGGGSNPDPGPEEADPAGDGPVQGCGEGLAGKHGKDADAWIERTCPPPTPGLETPPGPVAFFVTPTGARLEVEPQREPEPIEVVLHSRLTTDRKARRTIPERWKWDFGDGTRETYDEPGADQSIRRHTFPGPGDYRVTVRSLANDGRLLREKSWITTVPPGEPPLQELRLDTIGETVPELEIIGPVEWVVGRPAPFHLRLRLHPGRYLEKVYVDFDPGSTFEVRWKRPGTYVVRAAVTLRLNYRLPERRITLYNTYVTAVKVRVLGNSVRN